MKESFKFIFSKISLLGILAAILTVNLPHILILTYDGDYISTTLGALRISGLFIVFAAIPSLIYLRHKNMKSLEHYYMGGATIGFIVGFTMLTVISLVTSSSSESFLVILLVSFFAGLGGAVAGILFAGAYWLVAIHRKLNLKFIIMLAIPMLIWIGILNMQRIMLMQNEGLRP